LWFENINYDIFWVYIYHYFATHSFENDKSNGR
jgi:hypothetical protein